MNSIKMEFPLLLSALFLWALIVAAALMTPRLTRPDLFFAVTVKPSFRDSPIGGQILRQYTWFVLIAALLALLPLGFIASSPPLMLLGLLGPVVVEVAGFFGAFLVARSRTIPHHVEPSAEREAALTPRQTSLPGGWLAQAGPLLILAVICLWLALSWDRIPPGIPIHWNASGLPDGWAAKSLPSVYGLPIIGMLICLLFFGLSCAIQHGARRIHSTGRAALRETQFVRAISCFLLGTQYWLALLFGLLALAALRSDPKSPLPAFGPILLLQTILIGAIFLVAWRMGQGGWRLAATPEHKSPAPDAPPVGDRTPDECWTLGLIYFNRNDPALFVEKRFGVGWTLNFANPGSWLILGALLLIMIVSLMLPLLMKHHVHG